MMFRSLVALSTLSIAVLPAEPCWGEPACHEVYRAVSCADGREVAVEPSRGGLLAQKPATAVRDGAEFVLDNGGETKAGNGVCWNIELGQKKTLPFSMSIDSRFEQGPETPGEDPNYSLYLDLDYADGSKLYGQKHCFRAQAARGWQHGTVIVNPDKPVRCVRCYALYRWRSGRVRYRDLRLKTFADSTFASFDTVPVEVVDRRDAAMCLLHDAANPQDGWTALADGASAKGVRFHLDRTDRDGATFFTARFDALDDADHALTFAYSVPLPAGDLDWLDDPRTEVRMGSGQYRNTGDPGCGVGALSRWPFGAVRAAGQTFALGYDYDAPGIFRVVGNGALRRLFIAFDLGLAREKKDAVVKFVSFRSPGPEGFRGALEKYASLFPDAYRLRIRKHGIWMAFQRISSVEGWQDFGFGIKEGDNEPAWDDAAGILTTHYTEPTSWWMTMKNAGAVTYEDALARARAEAGKPKGHPYAKAWVASTYHDEAGMVTGNLCDRPWCKGACWNMNPLPAIPGGEYQVKLAGPDFDRRYAGKTLPEGVDGEYIDSAECHLPPRVDFRRENYRYSQTPLCWAKGSCTPCVSTALAIYEYVRAVAERVHGMGRVMQANGAPYSWPWLIPFIDYGGQECKWIVRGEGAWSPQSDRDLLYRTAMAYGKPYCFLMNVKFELFTDEMVEKYFQRCLAYGLMSSFFSPNASGGHYFTRPELYNRHRHFFRKYGPLQRRVSEAGWRAVNRLAVSETDGVFAEQFGDRYVTVFNPTTATKTVRVRSLAGASKAAELTQGGSCLFASGVTELEIPPESVRLLDFAAP